MGLEEPRRVADYFLVAGLPHENPHLLEEYGLEVNLKPSAYQDPITDITVIIPSLGENVPDYYQLIDMTPTGLSANLNHGSFRSPEVFLCYRRGRDRPPLLDIGIIYDGKEKVAPDSQVVEFTQNGHTANVNNAQSSSTFLTYRRSSDKSACNELVVVDICVIVASKGEEPPHSFKKIDKTLNKGIMGSDVFICYKKSVNRPDVVSYKPALLYRYPAKDNLVYPLEETVSLFCMPMGATLECWPADATRSPAISSTFVLTLASRDKVYGSAITFYEEYNEDRLTEDQRQQLNLQKYSKKSDRKFFVNRCICLLSRWPFFEAFEQFLFFLHKVQLMGPYHIPLERYISQFLFDVPFPSPERPRILVQLSADEEIALFQPIELSLPRSGASFKNLLLSLGPDNCLLVLLLSLTEQKILFHSHRPSILTSVAEAVMHIIFPFYWQCPYIPLCPMGMWDYLAAPLPFVVGLDSRFFDLYDQPHDVTAIDLDTNTITLAAEKKYLNTKLLPKKPSRQLRTALISLQEKCLYQNKFKHKLEAHNDGTIDFIFKMKRQEMQLELEIREAFLHFALSILSGYKQYLLPITSAPTIGATDVNNLFDSQGFLRSRDRNYHKFYGMLMKTQMFTKFIEERSFVSETNLSLAFFDECMDHATNALQPVRFLEMDHCGSDRTVFILPPDASDLPDGRLYEYETFENLNADLFLHRGDDDEQMYQGRSAPCLVNGGHDCDGGIGAGRAGGHSTCGHSHLPSSVELSSSMACNLFSTPTSAIAKRTKQEIRSAQKQAKKQSESAFSWAKCLVNTTYSLWFIHLPSLVLANKNKHNSLKLGLAVVQRMHRLKLHLADEICYRVMMQLCGVYDQPVLAVKVMYEMNQIGLVPNAVTYGYYNKSVLESEWPSGEKSLSQVRWTKLKNVLLATQLFRMAAKENKTKFMYIRSTATCHLPPPPSLRQSSPSLPAEADLSGTTRTETENISHTSASCDALASSTITASTTPTTVSSTSVTVSNVEQSVSFDTTEPDPNSTLKTPESQEDLNNSLTHGTEQTKCNDTEVNSESEIGIQITGKLECNSAENDEHSIIVLSPSSSKETDSENISSAVDLLVKKEDNSPRNRKRDSFVDQRTVLPFSHLPDLGIRAMEDLCLGQDRDIVDKLQPRFSCGASSAAVSRVLFPCSEECPTDNPASRPTHDCDIRVSVLSDDDEDLTPYNESGQVARSKKLASKSTISGGGLDVHSRASSTLPLAIHKVASSSSIKVPVTENDPLGALSPLVSKNNTLPKSATSPFSMNAVSPDKRLTTEQDILGTPFASKGNMARSSTMPLDEDRAFQTPGSTFSGSMSLAMSLSSIKNLTKSGQSRLNSLKKGGYFSGWTTGLSPSSKKAQDALTSIKSVYNSAATTLSKRVEELREYQTTPSKLLSPAVSSQYLNREDDALSNDSTADLSRRPSDASMMPETLSSTADTWNWTGQIWEQLWSSYSVIGSGDQQHLIHPSHTQMRDGSSLHASRMEPASSQPKSKAVTDLHEELYLHQPKRPAGPVAMELQMTSCSQCLYCNNILYDEEIMSGWSYEDSNLNTQCTFCKKWVVPFLSIRVIDFRTRPCTIANDTSTPTLSVDSLSVAGSENGAVNIQTENSQAFQQPASSARCHVTGDSSVQKQEADAEDKEAEPLLSDTIIVPYLSPLVLRKELESMLEREGDVGLIDPNCVDDHPIIYWNLVWYFERIAVKSHLPGLCLRAKSLNETVRKEDEKVTSTGPRYTGSWASADHRNVFIRCQWDNGALHSHLVRPPIYTLWQECSSDQTDSKEKIKALIHQQSPSWAKHLMEHILLSVCKGELLPPIEKLLLDRSKSLEESEDNGDEKAAVDGRTHYSVYREILFFSMISMNQDNIDLSAYDRKYSDAFSKLSQEFKKLANPNDEPPSSKTILCRKLFREPRL